MDVIKANQIVGRGFPTVEGQRLAEALLSRHDMDWGHVVIDLSDCDSALLISAFFNAFLQTIFEQRPELLEQARAIDWKLEFDFQRENVASWMADFEPYSVH